MTGPAGQCLKEAEPEEGIEKLFEKIAKENPKDKASWTIKVKSNEICGVFRKLD